MAELSHVTENHRRRRCLASIRVNMLTIKERTVVRPRFPRLLSLSTQCHLREGISPPEQLFAWDMGTFWAENPHPPKNPYVLDIKGWVYPKNLCEIRWRSDSRALEQYGLIFSYNARLTWYMLNKVWLRSTPARRLKYDFWQVTWP